MTGPPRSVARRVLGARHRIPPLGVQRLGLPPSWFAYRSIRREGLREHLSRVGAPASALSEIHPETEFRNDLPRNVSERKSLPTERLWWGFSYHDVPSRNSAATLFGTVPDARVVHCKHPIRWWYSPAVLTRDDRSLELREIRFREEHGALLSRWSPARKRVRKATWILERVYTNHAHWITAHLPKLILLQDRGLLDGLYMPLESTPTIDASLRMLGLDRRGFSALAPGTVLEAEELTVFDTDRLRPELLQLVRSRLRPSRAPSGDRRVFISRAGATKRALHNEDEIWPLLEPFGFQRVRMESLEFEEQVELMHDSEVVVGLHGAGLANIVFCPEGTQIVELMDPTNASPNFYALAAGLGLDYWMVQGHPLEQDRSQGEWDVAVDPDDLETVLSSVFSAGGQAR